MLAFNVKSTSPAPVSKVLSPFVDSQKWKAGASFVQELDAWREKVRQLRYSVQGAQRCRDGTLHYYKLATHAAHHFRGVNLATEAKLSFRWHDTFSPKLSVAQPDWRYERAAVLFNLAASLSYLATLQDRGDPEGMKLACKYFQEAAGAIAEVRCVSKEGAWVEYTPDMTNDFLEALEALMLAQAQKCFYEKAVADGRPHALIAKLAAECAALYGDAWLKLDSPVLQQAIVRQSAPCHQRAPDSCLSALVTLSSHRHRPPPCTRHLAAPASCASHGRRLSLSSSRDTDVSREHGHAMAVNTPTPWLWPTPWL